MAFHALSLTWGIRFFLWVVAQKIQISSNSPTGSRALPSIQKVHKTSVKILITFSPDYADVWKAVVLFLLTD